MVTNARTATVLICVLALAASVAGCSGTTLSSMLSGPGSNGDNSEPSLVVALAPLIGPPPEFTDALVRELNQAALAANIAVLVDADAKGDYLLRGNFIASRSNNKVLLAYNWDVLDNSGNRVSRVTGEESQDSAPSPAPAWSSISPPTIKATVTKLIASLVKLGKRTAAAVP